ncbi:MAG: polysaccharide biosynthesis C-terminal domain-containing protein, partial [Clostridia bacterium]
ISIVQSGINTFWTPFVFEHFSTKPTYLSSGHRLITFVMAIFGLGVVLFQDVLYQIIGPNYRASQQFFALLLFSPICYTISETTGIGINLSKKTYLNFVVYGATILITFAACYLLIPSIGLLGAAIAVAIASFCSLIIKTVIGERYYKVITSPLKSFFPPTILLIAFSLNTVFLNMFWIRTLITIISAIVICIMYRTEWVLLMGMVRDWMGKKRLES